MRDIEELVEVLKMDMSDSIEQLIKGREFQTNPKDAVLEHAKIVYTKLEELQSNIKMLMSKVKLSPENSRMSISSEIKKLARSCLIQASEEHGGPHNNSAQFVGKFFDNSGDGNYDQEYVELYAKKVIQWAKFDTSEFYGEKLGTEFSDVVHFIDWAGKKFWWGYFGEGKALIDDNEIEAENGVARFVAGDEGAPGHKRGGAILSKDTDGLELVNAGNDIYEHDINLSSPKTNLKDIAPKRPLN